MGGLEVRQPLEVQAGIGYPDIMSQIARVVLALTLSVSLTGCLGTIVNAPTNKGRTYGGTQAHLLLAPTEIDARDCPKGLQEVAVYVPLWGVAVGILTFGILVPMNTTFTCVQ
jgi:hypothetical protein